MLVRAYCEVFAKKYATALRVAVAKELVEKYGMSQLEASRLAGVPQPLLNYVLRGRRRPRGLDEVERDPEARKLVESAAEALSKGKVVSMCSLCAEARKRCPSIAGGIP